MATAATARFVYRSGAVRNPQPLNSAVLDQVLCSISLALGLFHAWLGRNSMNPDGISYMDVGDALVRGNWSLAVNGWWSPLYAWIVGVVEFLFKPTPRWEFPLVHAVNFAVFAFALMSFRFLLHTLLAFNSEPKGQILPAGDQRASLTPSSLMLLGYALFWWISL
jgi:hypothetical protein